MSALPKATVFLGRDLSLNLWSALSEAGLETAAEGGAARVRQKARVTAYFSWTAPSDFLEFTESVASWKPHEEAA